MQQSIYRPAMDGFGAAEYVESKSDLISEPEVLHVSVENLKHEYLEALRRDELRHRRHRTTPSIIIPAQSLPNISEETELEPENGSPPRGKPSQYHSLTDLRVRRESDLVSLGGWPSRRR